MLKNNTLYLVFDRLHLHILLSFSAFWHVLRPVNMRMNTYNGRKPTFSLFIQ